jgi:predicted O-methyltransferase YrrM
MSHLRTLPSRVATTLWRRQHPYWSLDEPGAPTFELSWGQTPRYLKDRLDERLRRRRYREDMPWVTADAVDAMATLLRPTDVGLEFGAGSSTLWFARHTARVISIEPSLAWYDDIGRKLAEAGLTNADLRHVPGVDGSPEHRAAVLGVVDQLGAAALDYVFVDGLYRDEEALRATEVVRSGGVVIVDNVNTYLPSPSLPSPSRSPWHVPAPATPVWKDFVDAVAGWRQLWTTNGVWDTALWIKP